MKTNNQKRKTILTGEVLAEISSKLPPPTKANRLFWRIFIVFVVVAISALFTMTTISTKQMGFLWIGPTLGIMLGFLLEYVTKMVFARAYPLVFTTRGITAGPYINALWEDINTFRFEKMEGLNRHTVSKIGTGTSIRVRCKGFFSQSTEAPSGDSAFATQGYFFDDQQQADIRRIFLERGIPEELC